MKAAFALAAAAALAVGAQAQIQGLPNCAQDCVSIPQGCQSTDFKCICSDREFITNISCCIASSCNAADQQTVIHFAQALCGSNGVSQLPSTATCASTASQTAKPTGSSGGNGTVASGTVTTTKTTTTTATAGVGAALLPDALQAGGVAGAIAGVFAMF